MDNSEEKYRALVESAYDSILIIKDSIITFANRRAFELSGYTEEELINKPYSNFITPDDIIKIGESYKYRQENNIKHHKYRTKVIPKNGIHKSVEISSTKFQYNGDQAEMVVIKDISEQLASENIREQELLLLRTLIDHLPNSIFVIDKNYRKTIFNDLHLKRVNSNLNDKDKLTYADLIGKTNWEVYPKELADYYFIEDKKVIEEGYTVINRETQGVDLDGNVMWESISKIPMRNYNGEIIGLVGFAHDITKIKKNESILQESEENFRRAILYAPFPMMIFTDDNKLIQVSEGWINSSGYYMDEVKSITEWISKAVKDAKETDNLEKQDFSNIIKKYLSGEKEIICSNGSTGIWNFTTTLIGLTADSKHLYLSSAIDLTERKMIENEIIKLNNILEKRVKERTSQLEIANHDLEAFAYSISHDLKAPLRHIESFSYLLKKNLNELSTDAEKYLSKIIDSTKKMNSMIEALLTFSRLGSKSLEFTNIDLNELVNKIIKHFENEIENRKIEWRISSLPVIKGDYKLVEMAFENLISNAIKFTSKKEIAKIEITKIQKSINHCVICINDNGAGFNMAYAGKIFNVFQRLHSDKEFEGTGIGLANVKQIINKHGWSISFESSEGKGSSFYINIIA